MCINFWEVKRQIKDIGKVIAMVGIGLGEIVVTGILLAIGFCIGDKIINKVSGRKKEKETN